MIIAVDFDGTVVEESFDYDKLSELKLTPGAKEGLAALKRADHVLVLCSGRANLALRVDWTRNPLWVNHVVPLDVRAWTVRRAMAEQRFEQMVEFVRRELPGIFDAIDDGQQGKVLADVFIDDRACREVGAFGMDWGKIARTWGEPA